MAEKKSAACCGKIVTHKKDGDPYAHVCVEPTAQQREATRQMDAATAAAALVDRSAPVFPALSDPDVQRRAIEALEARTPEQKAATAARMDTRVSDLLGVPRDVPPAFPASFDGECDTCDGAIFEGDEIRSDGSGGWECASHVEEPVCDHPNGVGMDNCASCNAVAPDAAHTAPLADPATCDHFFTWADDGNGHEGSFCTRCGTEDTGQLKAERAAAGRARYVAQYGGNEITSLVAPSRAGTEADGDVMNALDKAAAQHCTMGRCTGCCGCSSQCTGAPCDMPGGTTPPIPDQPTEGDEFLDPTEPAPKLNVSGQPDARYVWRGKTNMGYMVKLPETGDFRRYKNGSVKGLTRCTTFNKAASDQNALSDWGKRNVLIGASLRPDLVAKAHGLTHADDKGRLMSLVSELETAAGAKVSADIGTMIHEITERLDGDPTYKIADVPAQFREAALLYRTTLLAHGLRPVQGLIERTTYVPEFGGVVGTLDRVYYHEKSGTYLIGDVKTGKTLEYGMDEIETQEAIYARGVNGAGVYDWNTDTWCPPGSYGDSVGTGPWQVPPVSEDWGIVIHMPVQGDDAGKCLLVEADLQRGWRHAKVCYDVRVERANKPKPRPWTGDRLMAPETPVRGYSEESYESWTEEHPTPQILERPNPEGPCSYGCHQDGLNYRECHVHGAPTDAMWIARFRDIGSKADAAARWQEAKDAGVPPEDLARYVHVAQQRLLELAQRPEPVDWDAEFSQVQDTDDAGAAWKAAKAAGVEPMELQRLVQLAQKRLRELGVTG
jgi:hypothetical protein